MLRNYIKIAWRNLLRSKLHTSINVFGLAIAFSICVVLFLTAFFKLSYDSFHSQKDHLFQTRFHYGNQDGVETSSNMPMPMLPALKAEIPEVESASRVLTGRRENLRFIDKNVEKLVTRVDPDFFSMFDFPVLKGSAIIGLQDIALSESTALAMFGANEALGQQVYVGVEGQEKAFVVTAIVKDCPGNSSIQFDALTRIESLNNYRQNLDNWSDRAANIFIRINDQSDAATVENKLSAFVEKYFKEDLELAEASAEGFFNITLLPLEDVHLKGNKGTPIAIIYTLIGLGAFILLIASFNFVNLNLAKSFGRSREVGIRKSLGALKMQLFFQLWGEAVLMYSFGFVTGMAGAYAIIPVFNTSLNANLDVNMLYNPSFLGIMTGLFLLVTLIAGGLPALKISGLSIVEVLKGKLVESRPGRLRNGLLVAQFSISTLLICVSLIAGDQLDFLRQKPVGFDKEQVISIPVGNQLDGQKVLSRLRNELVNVPEIPSVSGSSVNLGKGKDRVTSRTTLGFDYKGEQLTADLCQVDFDYLETLNIPVLMGRDFNRSFASDTINGVIVTQSFAKAMQEENPVGKFYGGENEQSGNQIIGVIPDFNLYSPSEKELPIVLQISPQASIHYIFLKVSANESGLILSKLGGIWADVTANAPFNASFLDENIQAWYEEELVMTSIFGVASGIAIFLSCLGLFALSMMVIEMRIKEIGLRKVMGASVKSIVTLLSVHFLKLIFISLLIALPLAWIGMSKWLQSYAYRIDMKPFTFALVSALVCLVALLTVSYHSVKAALANPTKSIKSE